jgi:hypothetical protein
MRDMITASASELCMNFKTGEVVNSALLQDQIARFGRTDDRSILSFSRDAKIDIIVIGRITDRGSEIDIEFTAYSYDEPYHGKEICTYVRNTKISSGSSIREYGYIAQEQTAYFIADLFAVYQKKINVRRTQEGGFRSDEILNGIYPLHVPFINGDEGVLSVGKGNVKIESGNIATTDEIPEGSYVTVSNEEKSRQIREFIRGRKREIVCEQGKVEHSLFAIPVTPLLSLSAPIALPVGYYTYNDYTGLSLFTVNAAPWWYMSWKGIDGNILKIRHARKSFKTDSSYSRARYRFAVYTCFIGNGGLMVDMMAHGPLSRAARYEKREGYIANDSTALALALLTPGGGHFYRGSRGWGYFYYQIDTALMYLTMRAYSPDRNDRLWNERGIVRRGNARKFLAAAFAVKCVEAAHAYMTDDDIYGDDNFAMRSVYPVIETDDRGTIRAGLAMAYRW